MSEPHFNGPLAQYLRSALPPASPDPWPPELDQAVRQADATPLCVSCLRPQDGHFWFCPNCGFPSGNYAAAMPYVSLFLDGELFRRGVSGPPEPGLGRTFFLVIYSASTYHVFAPLYWFWMVRKAVGRPICQQYRKEYVVEHESGSENQTP